MEEGSAGIDGLTKVADWQEVGILTKVADRGEVGILTKVADWGK